MYNPRVPITIFLTSETVQKLHEILSTSNIRSRSELISNIIENHLENPHNITAPSPRYVEKSSTTTLQILKELSDEFTTKEFCDLIVAEGLSRRTGENSLGKLVKVGKITRVKAGFYKKINP